MRLDECWGEFGDFVVRAVSFDSILKDYENEENIDESVHMLVDRKRDKVKNTVSERDKVRDRLCEEDKLKDTTRVSEREKYQDRLCEGEREISR